MPEAIAPPPSLAQLKIDRSAAPIRKRRRRWLPWTLAAVAVAGVAAALLAPRKTEVQASSVLTAYPSQQYAELTASGYVVAQRRAAVSSKSTGRLIELRVREGSLVRDGELIGRIDASDVDASLVAARAGVNQGEAGRTQAEATLRQAQVERSNAEVELKRQQDLKQQGFISAQAVDAAERRAQAARVQVDWSQAAIASAQAALAVGQAQVAMQQVNRSHTEIRAPFDGVVLIKNANVGDMITPFSSAAGTSGAVVTMADMKTLEVEADVSEAQVAKVRADQPVEITLDAIPEARFRGSVARIVPTVDRAKATVMTKIRFEGLDPRILPEMSAKVTFLSRAASDDDQKPLIAVNPKTVVQRDGATLVFRIQGDSVEAIAVATGRKLGDAVELLKPTLKSGDRLVLSPSEKLKAGDKIALTTK